MSNREDSWRRGEGPAQKAEGWKATLRSGRSWRLSIKETAGGPCSSTRRRGA